MGAVKSAVGGVTNFLVGGKQNPATSRIDARTPEEQALIDGLQKNLQGMYDNQSDQYKSDSSSSNDITDAFRQHLTSYLANNGNATPEELAQATQFVDSTFTAPTQNAINQYNSDFQDSQNAKAAALGRNPNADVATNQAIYGEGQRNAMNLAAERGARIQQQAQNNQLNTLNAGSSGSNFLNSLTQQAFSNRLTALNGLSGIGNYYQADRMANRTSMAQSTQPGLLTNMTAIGKGLGDFNQQWAVRPAQQGSQVMSSIGNMMSMGAGGLGGMGGGGGGAG